MKLFILGAGPQGRIALEAARAAARHEEVAFIDDNRELWGRQVLDAAVEGGFEHLCQQDRTRFELVIGIGNPNTRHKIAAKAAARNISMCNLVHPSVVLSPSARMGAGNQLCFGTMLNCGSRLGNYTLLNPRVLIDHDAVVEDGATIGAGAVIGSCVKVGKGVFVGLSATVLPCVTIGEGSIVGAQAMVAKDVPDHVMVVGSPARVMWKVDETFDWQRLHV